MKINKNENFSEWYNSVIALAELCDLRYNIKGFIVIRPWAMEVIENIYQLYDEELKRTGHSPVFFPSLIPERNFQLEAEHVEGFTPEVLWVTEAGDKKLEERYALRPTGETAFYQMYSLWINGRSDLPLKLYQKNWVWRYETKATKPFIRGREFLWIEAHDAFATEEEAIAQVIQDIEIANKVIRKKLGIPYFVFKRPEYDKFAGAVSTFAGDTLMPDSRVLQIFTTHYLGEKFAKAFNIQFLDVDGEKKYVKQTCYGPGISRIFAALISIHGDNNGLRLLSFLSPIQIVIVPIYTDETKEKIVEYAKRVEAHCKKLGFRVKLDLRERKPGWKYYYWEVRGVPMRIEIGEKELNEGRVLVKMRTGKKEEIPFSLLTKEKIEEMFEIYDEQLRDEAKGFFTSKIKTINSLEEVKGRNFLYRFPICEIDDEEHASFLKEEYSLDIRGILVSDGTKIDLNGIEKPGGKKCIICGKEAKYYAYVARQY